MKCTADYLNHHGHRELALDGYRRGSLATIGHRARAGLRAAALLAASTVCLVLPGQAMAQETRAETIRQEQADKQSTVTPPELTRAEKDALLRTQAARARAGTQSESVSANELTANTRQAGACAIVDVSGRDR